MSATNIQNGDEASPSISLVGRGILVKVLITDELHGIFYSHFAYLYILNMSISIIMQRPGTEATSIQIQPSTLDQETTRIANSQNTKITLVCKTMTMLCRASVRPVVVS